MKNVRFSGDHPRCATPEDYKLWRRSVWDHKVPPEKALRAGFCEDCTPEYQAKMKAQGKCENPHVRFVLWDGFVSGCALTDAEIDEMGLEVVE